MKKTLFLIAGHLSLLLGIVGAFLPVLPTTPFLLLALFCYSKSSVRLHSWLIEHRYFGPPIRDWEESGAIGIKAKMLATVMISLVLFFRMPTLNVVPVIKWAASSILVFVLIFIWSRPGSKK